jgi:hypothetical protein
VARLQAVAILVAMVLLAVFAWLHEHDKRLKHEVESQHRADSLSYDAKQIEGLREALVVVNSEFQRRTKVYAEGQKTLHDSLSSVRTRIGTLLATVDSLLPDGSKHLASDINEACKSQADMIETQLILCDSLRMQAMQLIGQRDTIIWRLQNSRDGYKQQYEDERKRTTPSQFWAPVGKVATFGGIVAVVGRLVHLW